MEPGLTMIYWGYGKGKTTAAIGLALRALGQGQRVLFVQFMKGGAAAGWETGEGKMFNALMESKRELGQPFGWTPDELNGPYLEFHVTGKGWVRIMDDKKPFEDHERAAQDGLAYSKEQMARGKWDVVILDEILSAVDSALLTVDDIKKLIRVKSPEAHLLMTGHKEYPELAEVADLVTKFEKVKHPYDKGALAQKGVDY